MKKIKRKAILLLFTLISVIIFCGTVSATDPVDPANIYVSPTGNDTIGDGSSGNPYQTIEIGLITVNNAGTIHLASGTYYSNTTGHRDYGLEITKNITISGAGKDRTIIDAGGNSGIFNILGTVTIRDITFINGNETGYGSGGAIGNYGSLTLTNCKFENNTAKNGGAIVNGKNLTITNCDFTSNTAPTGAGGAIQSDGNLTIKDSTFKSNRGYWDAGSIYMSGTDTLAILTITGCNFENNDCRNGAGSNGGAIMCTDANSTITNCIFKNNSADRGGAIYSNFVENMTITDSKFENNSADDGGAVYNEVSTIAITNSNFKGNIAFDGYGGAISNNCGISTINGCIFTNNSAYRGGAIYNRETDLNITGCNFQNNTAIDNGGAIYGRNIEVPSVLIVKYSRFVGNTVETGETETQDIYMDHQSLDAKYNWWGSNNGPTDRITGSQGSLPDSTGIPYLILRINADSSTINAGQTSKITANVYMDSAGGDHSVDAVQFFSGPEVTFKTNIGNVGSKEITVPWTLGLAFAILRGDEGAGIATLTAEDTQTLQTLVNIQQVPNPVDPSDSTVTVDAASKINKTVVMQETGLPIAGLVLAILMLFGGLVTSKR